MAAELLDETRVARRDRVEHVANIDAGDRARRAAQRSALGARESDHRPMQPILDAPGDEPDDALMPARIEQAQPERLAAGLIEAHRRGELDGLELHALLDLAPLLVEPGELRRERARRARRRPPAGRRCRCSCR